MSYDIAIIGGGPGGYEAAIRASQLGGKIVLIEKANLGGVCLNQGCIPTKTLLKSAEFWRELSELEHYGLSAQGLSYDYSKVFERKEKVVSQLRSGVEALVKSYGIDVVYGTASFVNKNTLRVFTANETLKLEAKAVIIATGSYPLRLPISGGNLKDIITSDELLELTEVPKRLTVIGAGAVGIEFAAIFAAFGSEVTVIEMLPNILPNIDIDLVRRMMPLLKKQGLRIMTNTKVSGFTEANEGVLVSIDTGKGLQELQTDKVLVATGRRPLIDDLNLDVAEVIFERNGIPVNSRMQTNVSGIYAIGDVTGQYMWAHAASAEGLVAVENIMGSDVEMDYQAIPGCIFTTPEIASVGLTEQEAKNLGISTVTSKISFASNGKAVANGQVEGLIKVVAEDSSNLVLGMHIMGAHASDLIMEGALAIKNALTAKQIAQTVHPHPTLSETVMETAKGVYSDPIHQLKIRRK